MTTHDVCPRFSADTLAHCGINTVCTNSHGSWSCPCASGYQDFVASVGCSDINECTDSNWGYWVGSVQIIICMRIHQYTTTKTLWNLTSFARSYCGPNSYCVDQAGWTAYGSYSCACNTGYERWASSSGELSSHAMIL